MVGQAGDKLRRHRGLQLRDQVQQAGVTGAGDRLQAGEQPEDALGAGRHQGRGGQGGEVPEKRAWQ